MSTTTDTGPAESGDDSFALLMDRLNSVTHRLKLAAGDLGEVADTLAEEHHSAAFVVVEAGAGAGPALRGSRDLVDPSRVHRDRYANPCSA
jgi:hypothetical protein